MAMQAKHVPKDAQVIMSIMKDMGIEEYEPRVINQLLEFTYRKYEWENGWYVYFLDSRNFLKPTFIHYILTKRTS
jgi:hypothetical protein